MNNVLIYVLESSICLGVFYLFYLTVLHNQTAYQYNRFYLLLASLLSFVLPLLEIPIGMSGGTSSIKGSGEGYFLLNPIAVNQADAAASSFNLSEAMMLLYAAGAGLTLFLFLKQIFHLIKIIRKNKHFTKEHYFLVHTEGKLPASSFFRYLFWDNTQQLSFYEQQQIMTHEEAHIRYGHSYDILYMALLKIVFWFHPLVYLYEKALIETHEYMADAEVLQRTHPKEYARLLTKRLFAHMELSLVNHFYKSRTLKRIKMMNLKNQKTPWYKLVLVVPIALTVFFVFSCQEESEMSKLDNLSEQYKDAKTDEEKAALADADEIFMVVEEQPEPEGGIQEFYKYVSENLKYPTEARQKGVEGKVFVQFVVNTDGSLAEVKAIKGIGSGCDEAAVSVIKEAPAWNPGKQRGKFVKVRMVMPITFRLSEGSPKAEADNIEGDQGEMNVQITRQGNMVKGTITAEDGNPVAGANIVITGTTTGTVTDREGTFTLQLEGDEQELAISHISYQHKQVKL